MGLHQLASITIGVPNVEETSAVLRRVRAVTNGADLLDAATAASSFGSLSALVAGWSSSASGPTTRTTWIA